LQGKNKTIVRQNTANNDETTIKTKQMTRKRGLCGTVEDACTELWKRKKQNPEKGKMCTLSVYFCIQSVDESDLVM